MSDLLAHLNPPQLAAVTLPPQHALILAGAGSVKTRVLTTRIAWLISTGQVGAQGVLAVTFTNKAAKEMQARLAALLPINTRGMWIGTFHGLCNRFLRAHHREAGLPAQFQILDSSDQLAAIKRLLKNLGIADEQFRKILDNNIVANHWLISMAAPQMIERRDGSIIIVSSIGGLRGSPVIGAYGISKAADMQLARNLAVEFGPHNVRVNCIAPGLIRTDFAKALWEDEAMLAQRTRTTPLRRIGEPDEIAGAAVFLASQAGSFVTGQSLVIDGGVTI